MRDGGDISFPVDDVRKMVDQVRCLACSVDPVFIEVGGKLSAALSTLNTLQNDFTALLERLESGNTARIRRDLVGIARKSLQLSGSVDNDGSSLSPILHVVEQVERPLAVLKKIGTEVGALSVNAKVLAAQVRVEGVDFTVFTQEIGRLGVMGAEAVDKTEGSLDAVRHSMDQARTAMTSFGKASAQELDQVANRMETCVLAFENRQAASRQSVENISRISKQIGERVAQCVASLQINDLTSQRIEHIATALEKVCALAEGGARNNEEFSWAADFDDQRLSALVRHVCTLQIDQFNHALDEFYAEIERLKANLVAMGADIQDILKDAGQIFHGEEGDSFIRDVQIHADKASRLLSEYAQARQRICGLMETVAAGFDSMRRDIDGINSIDADLRVMGLNATFKCGRLGTSGRALGVVAQELRACSRRTEEASIAVSESIDTVLDAVSSLVVRADDEDSKALALTAQTSDTVRELDQLAQGMETSLMTILEDGFSPLSALLDRTGGSIEIHHILKREVSSILDRLFQIVQSIPVDGRSLTQVQDDIHKLLSAHYTMAGERTIHDMFDTNFDTLAEVKATTASTQSLDDIFF